MNKNAFLVMAHNDFGILKRMVRILDHDRNDFYIHIDKRVKQIEAVMRSIEHACKRSRIFWVPRIKVGWGGV